MNIGVALERWMVGQVASVILRWRWRRLIAYARKLFRDTPWDANEMIVVASMLELDSGPGAIDRIGSHLSAMRSLSEEASRLNAHPFDLLRKRRASA